MTTTIPPELQKRIDAIASRSSLTAEQIVADALENGHSLEWQEHFLAKVARGIEAADRGDFASENDLKVLRNKYRSS